MLTSLEDAVLRMFGKRAVQRRLKDLHQPEVEEKSIALLHSRSLLIPYRAYTYPGSLLRHLEASSGGRLVSPV